MKWYFSFVLLVLVGVFVYQILLMKQLEPSLASLRSPTNVTGTMHYKGLGRMGDEPLLDGRPLYCSANFLGGKSECNLFVSSLSEGSAASASVVELKTRAGVILLALEIRTNSGGYYHAEPENVLREWRRQSYRALWQTPIMLFVAFCALAIPWAFGLKSNT